MFVTGKSKFCLVEEWEVSWYGASINFYVAWGHFWDHEKYYQQTKHGA